MEDTLVKAFWMIWFLIIAILIYDKSDADTILARAAQNPANAAGCGMEYSPAGMQIVPGFRG